MMTRKEFNELAAALAATEATHQTVVEVAKVCKRSNTRFDYVRFYEAATYRGLTDEQAARHDEALRCGASAEDAMEAATF